MTDKRTVHESRLTLPWFYHKQLGTWIIELCFSLLQERSLRTSSEHPSIWHNTLSSVAATSLSSKQFGDHFHLHFPLNTNSRSWLKTMPLDNEFQTKNGIGSWWGQNSQLRPHWLHRHRAGPSIASKESLFWAIIPGSWPHTVTAHQLQGRPCRIRVSTSTKPLAFRFPLVGWRQLSVEGN